MTLALATFDDVEAVSKPVLGDDRAKVARLIEMISGAVVRYTGRHFAHVVDDRITLRPHDGVVRLPQQPVTAVSEVRQQGRLLAAESYEWDPNGYLRRSWTYSMSWDLSDDYDVYLGWGSGLDAGYGPYNPTGRPLDELGWAPVPLTVTYSHGYAPGDYPPDVVLVVAEKVARMWTYSIDDVQSESIDGYAVRYQRPSPMGMWSPEHKAILDGYRRSGAASLRLS